MLGITLATTLNELFEGLKGCGNWELGPIIKVGIGLFFLILGIRVLAVSFDAPKNPQGEIIWGKINVDWNAVIAGGLCALGGIVVLANV